MIGRQSTATTVYCSLIGQSGLTRSRIAQSLVSQLFTVARYVLYFDYLPELKAGVFNAKYFLNILNIF